MNETMAPIIIIGMHRSGTSMLTRMLEELGLFVGKKKQRNHEAKFFFHINEWLFRQCGASWDNPEIFKRLLDNRELRSSAIQYIRFLMNSPYVILFSGLRKYFHYRSPGNLPIPWGWKDPRNTYTLPLWLDIFPNAKVVHIYRHGVDVAQSLRVRHERTLRHIINVTSLQKILYWYIWIRRKRPLWLTVRCASLEGGISLWEEYLCQAKNCMDSLGERAIDLKYEDLLAEPVETLKSLSHFCGLSNPESVIKNVAGRAKKRRAYAYMSNPDLQEFALLITDRLRLLGY